MNPYCVSTAIANNPDISSLSMTVMALSEEAAVQSVLSYLQLEFDLPPDATYDYRLK